MLFSLTSQPLDPQQLQSDLRNKKAGGYCSFEGWVRDHHLGRDVTSLTYEAYEAMARKEGERILKQALARFDILDARAVHRIGPLKPGELAVWVGVTAVHRAPAFDACQHIIDALKDEVPIWKHEFYADGTDEWVEPAHCSCSRRQTGSD